MKTKMAAFRLMRIHLPVACLLAGANLAHAQASVTLYGIIDEGLNYQSNAGGKALVNLSSGVLSGSRWGLKGREDLGSGWAAVFVLENGFDVNSGSLSQGGRMFGRQAFVGLASARYGSLTLGRQYDSVVTSLGEFAVGDQWGGYITAHPGDLDNFNNTVRTNNAIRYASVDYGGFSISGLYAPGGVAGSISGNQVWSVGANLVRGPWRLGAAYLNARTPNMGFFSNSSASSVTPATVSLASPVTTGFVSAHSYGVAAAALAYRFGRATAGLTYSNIRYAGLGDLSSGGDPRGYRGTAVFNDVEANLAYQLTPALLIGTAYNYTHGGAVSSASGDKPAASYHQISAGADYFLSKRTDVYGVLVYQKASGIDSRGVQAVAAINNLTPSASNHACVLRVALRHKF